MIFQLNYNNFGEKLVFPINPPKYDVTPGGNDYNDFTRIEGGEATVIGDKKLRRVAWSSYFPAHYDPFLCSTSDIPDPWDAVQTIEKWKKKPKPCRLIISGTNINMPVTIRDFKVSEQGGAVGDLNYDISFMEYPFISIRQIVVKNQQPKTEATSSRPDLQEKSGTYTVTAGDSLWAIAKKYYGDGSQYTKIYEANKGIVGNDPNRIYPGQTLSIP